MTGTLKQFFSDKGMRRMLVVVFLLAFVFAGWKALTTYADDMAMFLKISMKTRESGTGILYYDAGKGFNEDNISSSFIPGDGSFHELNFRIPLLTVINNLRFDPPLLKTGEAVINHVELVDHYGWVLQRFSLDRLKSIHHIKEFILDKDEIRFSVEEQADDPQILIGMDKPYHLDRVRISIILLRHILLDVMGTFLLSILMLFVWSRCRDRVVATLVVLALLAAGFVVYKAIASLNNKDISSIIEITMMADVRDSAKIYYDCGNGFNEANMVEVQTRSTSSFRVYSFRIPKQFGQLRFDPLTGRGNVMIRKIEIIDLYGRAKSIPLHLLNPTSDIKSMKFKGEDLVIAMDEQAKDPQIEIQKAVQFSPIADRSLHWRAFFKTILAGWGLIIIVFTFAIMISKRCATRFAYRRQAARAASRAFVTPKECLRLILLIAFFALVLLFYLWTVSSGRTWVFSPSRDAKESHSFMADAFLHGQLNLRVEPHPELLALEDPYDPVANGKYRQHDVSLYKGNYYLYFTPTVALLFILPFKLLFGYFIWEPTLTALLCFVGFAFSYFTLIRILKIGSIQTSLPTLLLSALVLAVANTAPFLLRRPAVYELCIAAGYGFMMAGTYFLVGALTSEQRKSLWAQTIAAGTLLGLCISLRPNQLFACGLLIIAFIVIRHFCFHEKFRMLITSFGFLIAPIVLIGISMCWYNYARFGSVFEFGASYQLTGMHPHQVNTRSPIYIPLGLYHYLLQTVSFDLRFPFFHALAPVSPIDIPFPYFCEPTVGLVGFPVYWLLLVPLFCLRSIWRISPAFLLISASMIAASLASLLAVSTGVGTTMRYIVDFSPLLLLATIALYLASRPLVFTMQSPGPTISRLSYCIPVLFTAVISISISMTGYSDELKTANRPLYEKIERAFSIDIKEITKRFYPMPKVPPDVPWAKLKNLRIVSIRNRNGIERNSSGKFFWLGNEVTEIELFSIKSGMAHFTVGAYPGPSLPKNDKRRIHISSGQHSMELLINGPQENFAFSVPIQAGKNVLRVQPIDKPTVSKLPDGDMRSRLVMFMNLQLAKVTDE